MGCLTVLEGISQYVWRLVPSVALPEAIIGSATVAKAKSPAYPLPDIV